MLLELRRTWSSKLLFSSTKDVTDPIFVCCCLKIRELVFTIFKPNLAKKFSFLLLKLSSPYSTMSDAITTNVSNELVLHFDLTG